jgi:hypothetical protein
MSAYVCEKDRPLAAEVGVGTMVALVPAMLKPKGVKVSFHPCSIFPDCVPMVQNRKLPVTSETTDLSASDFISEYLSINGRQQKVQEYMTVAAANLKSNWHRASKQTERESGHIVSKCQKQSPFRHRVKQMTYYEIQDDGYRHLENHL